MKALLVHGLGSDSYSWWRVVPALEAEEWEVFTVDLRGRDASPIADTEPVPIQPS